MRGKEYDANFQRTVQRMMELDAIYLATKQKRQERKQAGLVATYVSDIRRILQPLLLTLGIKSLV